MLKNEEQYMNYLISKDYSEQTIKKKKIHLKEFEDFIEKKLKEENILENYTKKNLEEFYCYLRNRKNKTRYNKNKKLSLSVILQKINDLKTYFDYLLEHKKIIKNPAREIEIIDKKDNIVKMNNISEQEILKFISVINTKTYIGFRNRVIIELMYNCGLRRAEVVELTIYDINFTENILIIKNTKSKKDRLVPLGDVIINYLKEYMLKVRKYLLNVSGMYSETLFMGIRGKKLKPEGITAMVYKYSNQSNVNITPHSFRHAFAIHMLRRGCDIRYIQEILGHTFLSTTTNYTKIIDNDLREKIKKYHPRENELYDKNELNKLKIICKK